MFIVFCFNKKQRDFRFASVSSPHLIATIVVMYDSDTLSNLPISILRLLRCAFALHLFRWSRNSLCVFIDLKSNDGIFNSDGCEIWRKRENWTLCRCNHLTNFALLAHDVFDEELWWRITMFNFRYALHSLLVFVVEKFLLLYSFRELSALIPQNQIKI